MKQTYETETMPMQDTLQRSSQLATNGAGRNQGDPKDRCIWNIERLACRRWVRTVACALLLFPGSLLTTSRLTIPQAAAEEPYQRFLSRLRDERLYDLALAYLDSHSEQRQRDAKFMADLELERGLLKYQSAAMLPLSSPTRSAQLDEAEKSLRKFLDERPRHPRRGEARLKVGELLLQRAEEAKSKSSDPTAANPEAVQFYDEAHKLFESTIAELAQILEGIKGARTDSNDSAAVAYRQKVQQDLRQAQLLSAKSVEERGRNRPNGSQDQKKDLQQALTMFSDLYSKEQRMIGVRNYALFYRSAIQDTLGKSSDAIDGYQRVADLEGIDDLRNLQAKAIQELLRLLAAEKKFPVAVDRADRWLSNLRPNERSSRETMDLKLELARTKIQWAEQLKKKDPDDRVASRLLRDTRSELTSMLRVRGPHLEATRELLSELGVDTDSQSDSDELPDVKDFSEAIAAAQQRIDRSESDSLAVAVLREQGKTAQAQEQEGSISRQRQQAIQLLRTGLQMYSDDDDLSALEQARFSMAYLLLKEQEPLSAYAVAEFVSRNNAKSDRGLNAAGIALFAMSDILRTAGEEKTKQMTDRLEPFAAYLVQTWPDSEEAASAASVLVQLSISNQDWDKLENYLAIAPTKGSAARKLRRSAGIAFFNRYEKAKKEAGEATDEVNLLKNRAIESLKLAIEGIPAEDIDNPTIDAINALARLYLGDDQTAAAAKLINDPKNSPLKLIEKSSNLSSTVAMNSYRTAIQLVTSRLANGEINSSEAIKKTKDYIGKMQKLAGKGDEGQKTLTGIFVALAKDLKTQLANATSSDQRKQLSEAMVILAKEAAGSDAFNTQYWAADTIISIAEEGSGDAQGRRLATEAYANAAQILQKILNQDKTSPGFIQPETARTQIQLLLAKASRGMGDNKTAINQLTEILKANPGFLDVQIEAARAYQAWGDASNLGFHKLAFLGGRKDPKSGKNIIWGWGKIARVVEGKKDFAEQFYLARYELARSRFKYASSLKDAAKKSNEMIKAEKSIIATATLYPELGGAAMKKKYDALLRVIQKELGKAQTGLAGLNT